MARASIEQLRRSRTKTVEVLVDGAPVQFEIAKIKVGQQRKLAAECVSERGDIDLDRLHCMMAQMCVVDPVLSDEDIDEIDGDVFVALSVLIAEHSGVAEARNLIAADPEEGSAEVKGFPAAGSAAGVG